MSGPRRREVFVLLFFNFIKFLIRNQFCYITTSNERRGSMDVVENEIIKELNWKERIIVKVFAKTFKKVYNKCRIRIVNSMLS